MINENNMLVRDGVSLKYIDSGESRGMPLVLIHGIADSWHAFELLLPYLDKSIRIIAPTLRGHGDSDKPESGYDSKEMADDVSELLNKLTFEKAVVLGASSGGLVARSIALRYPEKVSGLILVGSPLELCKNPNLRQLYDNEISKFGDEVDKDFVKGFVSGLSGTNVPSGFIEMMTEETMKMPSWVWKEYTASLLAERVPENISDINVPCLIIWGGKDEITGRSDQEEYARLIRDSRLKIHEGLGHMLYWEYPEAVADDINEFMHEMV
ncbi:alpha/beta fold hydrolase [Youngiibacter multivorans]|uniref:Rifampin ADP-ribosylating transferase n=1 Tax=Youngiibacter multivorans TaxID=937251 RepID=A0ABS4G5Z4_9CLOT|nr:alpha/beta hydrolase [Youngiibacter multivorans]MBP1919968.1 rifampin ADP-ribosylating transferase [Youngiibacter multivorans]